MKNFKILIFLSLICIVAGCSSSKTRIDDETVLNIMNKYNYDIIDYSDDYDIYDHAYYYESNDTKIKYLDGVYRNTIEGLFLDECNNALGDVKEDNTKYSKSGENWATLEIYDDSNYYYISYIDDTMVVASTSIGNKNNVRNLVKEFGF